MSLLGLYGTAPDQIQGGQTTLVAALLLVASSGSAEGTEVTQVSSSEGQEGSEQGSPEAERSGGHLGNLKGKGKPPFFWFEDKRKGSWLPKGEGSCK